MMVAAAFGYVAFAFAAGFALGVLREFVVRPFAGEIGALLIEAPLMLVASFVAARWTLRRFMPGADLTGRIGMGLLAFVLLMGLEAAGSLALRGLTLAAWFAQFGTLRGAISLALFVAFAAMPALAGLKRDATGST